MSEIANFLCQKLFKSFLNKILWKISYQEHIFLKLQFLEYFFLTFPAVFWIPMIFPNFNIDCSNKLDLRNLQLQVKKSFCHQKLFWPFSVWINYSSDLEILANSWPSASNFKRFSRSLKSLQNKKDQKNLGYPSKKQSFYKKKDCFFVGYPKSFWSFLFWSDFIYTVALN